jgi:hypothetical protein
MRLTMWSMSACLLGLALSVSSSRSAEPAVTVASLLEEVADLGQMARWPAVNYRLIQTSSAARGSKPWIAASPEDSFSPGRFEWVLFDAEGPGALVHLHLRTADHAVLRIYADGGREPILEGMLAEIAAGQVAPIVAPFVWQIDDALNIQFPVPYSDGCTVTLETETPEAMETIAYQVSARSYDSAVGVATFQAALSAPQQLAFDSARRRLESEDFAANATSSREIRLSRDRPLWESAAPSGGGMIASIRLRPSTADEMRLRQAVIAISFDGLTTVRVPMAEFFGSGPGVTPTESLMTRTTSDGVWHCRWPMPFAQRVQVRIEGVGEPTVTEEPLPEKRRRRGPVATLLRGRQRKKRVAVEPAIEEVFLAPPADIAVTGEIELAPYRWDDRSLYFHARWSSLADVSGQRPRDWTAVEIPGRGRYVGTVWVATNSVREAWSIGDVQIRTDGEDRALDWSDGVWEDCCLPPNRVLGSATSMYGLARSDGPQFAGRTSLYRWRILDGVPFTSGLRMNLDVRQQNPLGSLTLGAVHYWYGAAWDAADQPAVSVASIALPQPNIRATPRVPGAIEGESMKVLASTGGAPSTTDRVHFEAVGPWSGDRDLDWRGDQPGNELTVGFDAPRPGRYRVVGFFTQGPDAGIHRLSINDAAAGDALDLYQPAVARSAGIALGTFDLKQNENRLVVRVVSSSKTAEPKNCRFGLDCLVVEEVR